MAAPHIAGIAALYLEAYPSAAAYQVTTSACQITTSAYQVTTFAYQVTASAMCRVLLDKATHLMAFNMFMMHHCPEDLYTDVHTP